MTKIVIIFGIIASWLLIGYLVAKLKTYVWLHVLINQKKAIKEYKFENWKFLAQVSFFLVYPRQTFNWYWVDWTKTKRVKAIPITPLPSEDSMERSAINWAILHNQNSYETSYMLSKTTQKLDKNSFVKKNFGGLVLLGPLNIFLWLLSIAVITFCVVVILLVVLFSEILPKIIGNLLGKNITIKIDKTEEVTEE